MPFLLNPLEPMRGVEPRTSSLPRMRSNHLSYMGPTNLERETGFEPATPSLEGLCSSQLSYSRVVELLVSNGGEGRIRTSEGRSQQVYSLSRLTTSVPLRRPGPSVKKPAPTSTPTHSRPGRFVPYYVLALPVLCRVLAMSASSRSAPGGRGAGEGTRTSNLLITSQLLCQLSYASATFDCIRRFSVRQQSWRASSRLLRDPTDRAFPGHAPAEFQRCEAKERLPRQRH